MPGIAQHSTAQATDDDDDDGDDVTEADANDAAGRCVEFQCIHMMQTREYNDRYFCVVKHLCGGGNIH